MVWSIASNGKFIPMRTVFSMCYCVLVYVGSYTKKSSSSSPSSSSRSVANTTSEGAPSEGESRMFWFSTQSHSPANVRASTWFEHAFGCWCGIACWIYYLTSRLFAKCHTLKLNAELCSWKFQIWGSETFLPLFSFGTKTCNLIKSSNFVPFLSFQKLALNNVNNH